MRYRWKQKDRGWRKRQVRRAARKYKPGRYDSTRRIVLLTLLTLEVIIGTGQHMGNCGMHLDAVRGEETCQVEWVVPEAAGRALNEERFGIRFQPKTMEIQFYRSSQMIENH